MRDTGWRYRVTQIAPPSSAGSSVSCLTPEPSASIA
jgi:hypothetical protein